MSFFNHQPEMFDAKKRFVESSSIGVTPLPFNSSDRQLNSDEIDVSAPDSWVELAPSRNSLCSSVEAVIFEDPCAEASISKDSRLSPISVQSPCVELESNLEQVKYRLVKDIKNTDWIWDWSSRPEALPKNFARVKNDVIGSTLTTPPNSPEPGLYRHPMDLGSAFDTNSLVGQTGAISPKAGRWSSFWRFEVLVGLVVSNLVTFVLGATIGFCICKKAHKNEMNYYN